MRTLRTVFVALSIMTSTSAMLWAGSQTDVMVSGQSGPWIQALNPSFDYGIHDNLNPTIINSANSGITFIAGATLTIDYLSGTTSAGPGFPFVDANGVVNGSGGCGPGLSGLGGSGTALPCVYTDLSKNTWLMELMGVFTNSNGVIVGQPFTIGDGPYNAVIPVGATQLQLGVVDDAYANNLGSLEIEVNGATTPEPSTLLMLGSGLISVLGYRRFVG